MSISHDPGVWIAAFLTIGILSFLVKDNPLYKLAEYLFVGVSAGYSLALYFHTNIIDDMVKKLFPGLYGIADQAPDLRVIGGGILGLIILTRLIPNIGWLSRWGIAFIVGFNAGIQVFSQLSAWVFDQIEATIVPLFVTGNLGATLNSWVIIVSTLSGLCYFYFSKAHKGWFGTVGKVGIWFLMIAFGAGYGSTVMTRISIFLGRVQFLLGDWLGVVQ